MKMYSTLFISNSPLRNIGNIKKSLTVNELMAYYRDCLIKKRTEKETSKIFYYGFSEL